MEIRSEDFLDKFKSVGIKSADNPVEEAAPVIIAYHGNCADGFTAAWAARKYFQDFTPVDIEYHACFYSKPLPFDPIGKIVIFVDFCHNQREVMMGCVDTAYHTFILDHHKTAIQNFSEWIHDRFSDDPTESTITEKISTIFDITRSGARITWDSFHPGKPLPALIFHVEERDLWEKDSPTFDISKKILANVFSYAYTFENWDIINNELRNYAPTRGTDVLYPTFLLEGAAILRKHLKDCREMIVNNLGPIIVPGVHEPCAIINCSYFHSSDIGDLLAKDFPAVFCYQITYNGNNLSVTWSVRSSAENPKALDVADFARKFGGGGHKHAAGFTTPMYFTAAALISGVLDPDNLIKYQSPEVSHGKE